MCTDIQANEANLPVLRAMSSPYLRTVINNGIIYLSGQLPYKGADLGIRGIVGTTVSVEQAADAARQCALNALSVLRGELGSLSRVSQLLRLTGYIACSPDFGQQPTVMDAASETFVNYLGSRGLHSRTAIGVSSLPHGGPVELEVTAAVLA